LANTIDDADLQDGDLLRIQDAPVPGTTGPKWCQGITSVETGNVAGRWR
jgi:hypothetical protein